MGLMLIQSHLQALVAFDICLSLSPLITDRFQICWAWLMLSPDTCRNPYSESGFRPLQLDTTGPEPASLSDHLPRY